MRVTYINEGSHGEKEVWLSVPLKVSGSEVETPSGIIAFSHGSPCGDYVGWFRIISVSAIISGIWE